MALTEQAKERLALLEELTSIPGDFGFSVPKMEVIELLTHKGRTYQFYYDNKPKSFMTFEYDANLKEITNATISKARLEEFEDEKERFLAVSQQIKARIIEKNARNKTLHFAEYEGFLEKTKTLTQLTQSIAEEMVVMENKEEIKATLCQVETLLKGVQENIEGQKVMKLKEALSAID